MEKKITATADTAAVRLDVFVAQKADCTRSHAKTLIEDGNVRVNGANATKSGAALKVGDVVEIDVPAPKELNLEPQDIPVDIIWQDDDFAVVNKPQGMVVHPAPGSYDNTLVNALLFRLSSLSGINGVARPGIVHRLDKDTSGLLVVAKNDFAHAALQKQIAEKSAKRYYYALVDGALEKDCGEIRNFLARSVSDRKKYAVSKEGRLAVTLYKVVERYTAYTLVEYELKTGRTHQIRVHSKYIGHPVVGDRTYGGSDRFGLNGQLLHAHKLVLTHPRTGEEMTFEAPLPDYFVRVLESLKPLKK